jgi:putative sterol carrier protein
MSMAPTIDEIMQRLPAAFDPDRAQGLKANIQFDFTSDGGKKYVVRIADSSCTVEEGEIANPDAALITSQTTYQAVAEGRLNVATAFMTGKLKVQGNIQLLMRFQQIFHRL